MSSANGDQDLMLESGVDNMALIVSSPFVQLTLAREHHNIEIELDEGGDEVSG